MPLNPVTLADAIREFSDPDYSGFTGFPANPQETGQKWAAAFKRYMLLIGNPPPGAGTLAGHSSGETIMASTMAGILTPLPPTGVIALQNGLVAYVGVFSTSTAPFITLPPAGPPPIAITPPSPAQVAATTLATLIHAWCLTGLSSLPPPAPPLPWL